MCQSVNRVIDVAEYLNCCFGRLSKIKLHKLLYFAQAWYLVQNDKPLFDEDFYASDKGPVAKAIYDSLKDFKEFVPLQIPDADIDNLSDRDADFIATIVNSYGDKTMIHGKMRRKMNLFIRKR